MDKLLCMTIYKLYQQYHHHHHHRRRRRWSLSLSPSRQTIKQDVSALRYVRCYCSYFMKYNGDSHFCPGPVDSLMGGFTRQMTTLHIRINNHIGQCISQFNFRMHCIANNNIYASVAHGATQTMSKLEA